MVFRSPPLAPTLTVDSPRSPPREMTGQGDGQVPQGSQNASQESLASAPAWGHSQRPTSPNLSAEPPERLSPGSSRLQSPSDRKVKSASLPPPANRASKPKIPAKPANLLPQDATAAAPRSERAASEQSVSPFNTPPSSPERPSPKQLATRPAPPTPSPRPDRPGTEPPGRRSFDSRPSGPSTPVQHDAREMGFSRSRPGPESSRNTKPLMVQIPPSQPQPAEPMSTVTSAAPKLPPSDNPRDRPGLPPRHAPAQRPSPVSPARQAASTPTAATPTIRTELAPQSTGERPAPPVRRQPSFSRESKPETPTLPERRPRIEPEEGPGPDEAPVRTDYPDASQANRRPPVFNTGPQEIHTRYDTRLLDVCGKYVCTTGYLTRVWDLTTGEQVMSLSHGETVKCLSLSFKPGKTLEDEGKRLWLGTSSGELHEIDIHSQSVVATRSYPSRREVIKILRNKKEMWTIDEEGRLLVWPPDESGTPSLQYSYRSPHERVARGQTFSMAVGDTLWLATGKDVQIYRPNAGDDVSFRVLKRPLGSQHSGEVTSGAYTSKDGGLVYLGHADGKVTVYSSKDYSCLAVVNVSVYKINCLGVVGDYLWAAYKTGMIYVYDTRANPWVIKKDWRAHDSPVSAFLLDSSSVWTLNRLQVASLGMDNCIRLWDGMLEDDWLGKWFTLSCHMLTVQNPKCKVGMFSIAPSGRSVQW